MSPCTLYYVETGGSPCTLYCVETGCVTLHFVLCRNRGVSPCTLYYVETGGVTLHFVLCSRGVPPCTFVALHFILHKQGSRLALCTAQRVSPCTYYCAETGGLALHLLLWKKQGLRLELLCRNGFFSCTLNRAETELRGGEVEALLQGKCPPRKKKILPPNWAGCYNFEYSHTRPGSARTALKYYDWLQ